MEVPGRVVLLKKEVRVLERIVIDLLDGPTAERPTVKIYPLKFWDSHGYSEKIIGPLLVNVKSRGRRSRHRANC